jgi:hypothetical protein
MHSLVVTGVRNRATVKRSDDETGPIIRGFGDRLSGWLINWLRFRLFHRLSSGLYGNLCGIGSLVTSDEKNAVTNSNAKSE